MSWSGALTPNRGLCSSSVGRDSSISAIATSVDGELLDLRRQTSPDGAVTLLFTDIEGSTALIEQLGEARWFQLLKVHNAIVRRLTEGFDGTVVKSQGDGFSRLFRARMPRCSARSRSSGRSPLLRQALLSSFVCASACIQGS